MKLTEIKQPDKLLTTSAELRNWLSYNMQTNSCSPDEIDTSQGVINCTESIYLRQPMYTKLPVKFGVVSGNFVIGGSLNGGSHLETLEGCPDIVGREFNCSDTRIKTLEYIPKGMSGPVWLEDLQLDTLVGVHEQLPEVGGEINLSGSRVKEGGIGLILIKGLKRLNVTNMSPLTPFIIIKKYVGRPDDLFACQAELINAGFEEYAKL